MSYTKVFFTDPQLNWGFIYAKAPTTNSLPHYWDRLFWLMVSVT